MGSIVLGSRSYELFDSIFYYSYLTFSIYCLCLQILPNFLLLLSYAFLESYSFQILCVPTCRLTAEADYDYGVISIATFCMHSHACALGEILPGVQLIYRSMYRCPWLTDAMLRLRVYGT